jgi:hypothetical protein
VNVALRVFLAAIGGLAGVVVDGIVCPLACVAVGYPLDAPLPGAWALWLLAVPVAVGAMVGWCSSDRLLVWLQN